MYTGYLDDIAMLNSTMPARENDGKSFMTQESPQKALCCGLISVSQLANLLRIWLFIHVVEYPTSTAKP